MNRSYSVGKKNVVGQTFINKLLQILTNNGVLILIILIQMVVIAWLTFFKKKENQYKHENTKYKEDLRFNQVKEEIYLELQALKRLHSNIFRRILRMDIKIRKLIQLKCWQLSKWNKLKNKIKSSNTMKPEGTFQVNEMVNIFNHIQDIDELLSQTREKTTIKRKSA